MAVEGQHPTSSLESAYRLGKADALVDVVTALENFYNPQLHHVMHPADFITKRFHLDGHENLEYG